MPLRAAQRGYQAEERILETKQGFFEVYGGGVEGAVAGANVLRGLGETWDIVTDMAIKLVPGGHPYHALAEAAGNAARDGNIKPDEVESITLSRPGVTSLTGPLHPTDLIGMAHSPAYFLAAGVADHGMSWVNATQAKITDPVIHRLIDKVRVGPPPTEDVARYRQGATVTIRTTDRRTSTSTVYAPKGAGLGGIAWADINAKYHTLMPHSGLPDRQVEASLAVIHDFGRAEECLCADKFAAACRRHRRSADSGSGAGLGDHPRRRSPLRLGPAGSSPPSRPQSYLPRVNEMSVAAPDPQPNDGSRRIEPATTRVAIETLPRGRGAACGGMSNQWHKR